jgi:hypothetical protein
MQLIIYFNILEEHDGRIAVYHQPIPPGLLSFDHDEQSIYILDAQPSTFSRGDFNS